MQNVNSSKLLDGFRPFGKNYEVSGIVYLWFCFCFVFVFVLHCALKPIQFIGANFRLPISISNNHS